MISYSQWHLRGTKELWFNKDLFWDLTQILHSPFFILICSWFILNALFQSSSSYLPDSNLINFNPVLVAKLTRLSAIQRILWMKLMELRISWMWKESMINFTIHPPLTLQAAIWSTANNFMDVGQYTLQGSFQNSIYHREIIGGFNSSSWFLPKELELTFLHWLLYMIIQKIISSKWINFRQRWEIKRSQLQFRWTCSELDPSE